MLRHFQFTGFEDMTSLLYDCIILGFKYYSIHSLVTTSFKRLGMIKTIHSSGLQ